MKSYFVTVGQQNNTPNIAFLIIIKKNINDLNYQLNTRDEMKVLFKQLTVPSEKVFHQSC